MSLEISVQFGTLSFYRAEIIPFSMSFQVVSKDSEGIALIQFCLVGPPSIFVSGSLSWNDLSHQMQENICSYDKQHKLDKMKWNWKELKY